MDKDKKKTYFLFTLGCQMNVSDSQRIAQKLENIGYKSAPEKAADLVIINACSVRQTAVDRIWGKIKQWQANQKTIYLTGCVLPNDQKKLENKGVIFFNIKDLPQLIRKSQIKEYLEIPPKMDSKIAYIPIMTGCDNFCTYCAVPFTRGREISRPLKDIISDTKNALIKDYKEILLLGQNVNSYHTQGNLGFINLLQKIDELPYDFKFNFLSSNPYDFSDELIGTLSKLKKWSRELHLPLQSGDDGILKKMNRRYTSDQFLKLVANLKSQIPNLKITTDIIVGFPGETKEQFNNTVKVCKKIGFEKAYISQYSPRPGTTAEKLKDDVPRAEKQRRWKILDKLIN